MWSSRHRGGGDDCRGDEPMIAASRLCWILVNTVPYHEARLRAAAAHMPLRLCMVQLAGRDAFQVLQQSVQVGRKLRSTHIVSRPAMARD